MCKRGLRLSVIRNLIYLFDSLLKALGEMDRDKKKHLQISSNGMRMTHLSMKSQDTVH